MESPTAIIADVTPAGKAATAMEAAGAGAGAGAAVSELTCCAQPASATTAHAERVKRVETRSSIGVPRGLG